MPRSYIGEVPESAYGGDVVGPASATNGHVAVFSGTTGKIIADGGVPASGTVTSVSVITANGFSGTVATATTTPAITIIAGAITPSTVNGNTFTTGTYTLTGTAAKTLNFTNTLTLTGTDSTVMTFPGQTASVGYLNVPQNSKSAAYELVALDAGKQIYHPVGDANNRQFTIPKNATVPFTVGTMVTFTNMSANDITIVIDTDVLNYADTGVVTTITVPQYNMCTVNKTTSQGWLASGTTGVTTA